MDKKYHGVIEIREHQLLWKTMRFTTLQKFSWKVLPNILFTFLYFLYSYFAVLQSVPCFIQFDETGLQIFSIFTLPHVSSDLFTLKKFIGTVIQPDQHYSLFPVASNVLPISLFSRKILFHPKITPGKKHGKTGKSSFRGNLSLEKNEFKSFTKMGAAAKHKYGNQKPRIMCMRLENSIFPQKFLLLSAQKQLQVKNIAEKETSVSWKIFQWKNVSRLFAKMSETQTENNMDTPSRIKQTALRDTHPHSNTSYFPATRYWWAKTFPQMRNNPTSDHVELAATRTHQQVHQLGTDFAMEFIQDAITEWKLGQTVLRLTKEPTSASISANRGRRTKWKTTNSPATMHGRSYDRKIL